MSRPVFSGGEVPAVFPDWSPYQDLESAARAYLRDPDVALEALTGALRREQVLSFTLERFVNEDNGVWQEVAICTERRLILWHGEDVPDGDAPPGAMTSSLRVVPLLTVTEVGERRRLIRDADGGVRTHGIDVYMLLSSLDEAVHGDDPHGAARHDALRFGKTLEDGGAGQIDRLEQFARLVASKIGGAPRFEHGRA